ncbi:MAG: ComEC/Rec2 family competence protein, partial [Gammaproteobacteria bacterium]|nr:ComEC/Rec2 family competence protein [Gammaproteobacteria bacterium]
MRSGTIAFLLGILCVQCAAVLPDALYAQFLPITLLAAAIFRRGRLAALFFAGFLWSLFRAHLAVAEILPPHLAGADLIVQGTVVGVPEQRGPRTRFLFRIEHGQPARGNGVARGSAPWPVFSGPVRLSWYDAPELGSGERWRLTVRLRPPRGFANPGGFDYERWLFVNGVRGTGYVRDASASRRIERDGSWGIDGVRQQIAERIAQRLGDHPSAGIVTALAVGVRHGVSPQQWSVLRDTGTAHLMAISGLHVGLVAGFAFLAGGWLWSRVASACLIVPAPRAAAVAALLAGAGYAAMAGFSLPTQRALILLGVVVWCQMRGRRTPFSAALCLALGAVLAMDPFAVLGPSLWLSFGAVAVLG